MKRWSIIAVLIACLMSFLLIIDFRSEQGMLNSVDMESKESIHSQRITNSTESKEEQDVQQKNTDIVVQKEGAVEKQEVKALSVSSTSTVETDPFVVVIDPGHQAKANLELEPIGPGAKETKYKVTGGTTGVLTKKPEYVLTLEASNLLKDLLEKKGFKVFLTRSSHDVNISNRERAEIANRQGADLFVRIHADGSENPKTRGFSVLVPGKENPYTTVIYEDSYKAAQMIIANIAKEVPLHQNGIFFRNDMSGFNWSKVPVVLLEIGFMTNPEEDKKLSEDVYLTNLMKLLASGIEQYATFKQEQKN